MGLFFPQEMASLNGEISSQRGTSIDEIFQSAKKSHGQINYNQELDRCKCHFHPFHVLTLKICQVIVKSNGPL